MFSLKPNRNKKGSMLSLGTALGFFIVVLGAGFVFLVLFMGGQKEVKSATDAGMLNVGKRNIDDIWVPVLPTSTYFDCTGDYPDKLMDLDGKMNLRRINRVWAKALMIAINDQAAHSDGGAGSSQSSADSAYNEAKALSDLLAARLLDQVTMQGYFNTVSTQNSARMLGNGVNTSAKGGNNWKTSCMDRGCESNITMNGAPPFKFPNGFSLVNSYYSKTSRSPVPSGAQNTWFLKGYNAMKVGNHDYWQVPFKYDEKPHLVSQSTFEKDMPANTALSWSSPVPNAFSGEGQAMKNANDGEKAISWVLSNPRQNYQMAIPHSFVNIHIDKPKSHWYFFPGAFPVEFKLAEQSYGFIPDYQTASMPAGGILCATVTTSATIGSEIAGADLDGMVFRPPNLPGNRTMEYLVSRCNEMMTVPGATITSTDVHAALSDPICTAALWSGASDDFVLFSTDGKSISCRPKEAVLGFAPWLIKVISNSPDGTEVMALNGGMIPFPFIAPPIIVPDPFCTQNIDYAYGSIQMDVGWTPGSGYNGCLGKLRVKRWTDIYSIAACNPL